MFPESAPVANPVFYRTYSRRTDTGLRRKLESGMRSHFRRINKTMATQYTRR
ncbi:MAG: hypothetical protein ACKPH3_20210 [Dolichospermum sp.]